MEMILIKENSSEWHSMWSWLETHPINEGLEAPSIATNDGESWQYMGSYRQKDITIHEFRHRKHPTAGLITVKVIAEGKVSEAEIEKIIKMK
jgi:hypothetical protein